MVHGDEEYVWGRVMGWDPIGHYTQEFWLGHPADEATVLDVRFTEASAAARLVRLVHSGWVPGTEDVRGKFTHWDDLSGATPRTCRDPAVIRPMREADVEAFGEITATSYYEVDARTYQRAWPDPVRRPPGRNGAWIDRARAALATDPGGCWVAEVDGEVVGGAVSRVRELMWILASFAVRPEQQGRGHRHPADGRRDAPRSRLPARHVRRERRPGRRTPLPAGRLRPAPADAPHGRRRPQRAPGGGPGAGGHGRRHRPAATPSTGRRAAQRTSPTTSCCSTSSAWSSATTRPGPATPTSTSDGRRRCSPPPTGVRRPS